MLSMAQYAGVIQASIAQAAAEWMSSFCSSILNSLNLVKTPQASGRRPKIKEYQKFAEITNVLHCSDIALRNLPCSGGRSGFSICSVGWLPLGWEALVCPTSLVGWFTWRWGTCGRSTFSVGWLPLGWGPLVCPTSLVGWFPWRWGTCGRSTFSVQ